MDGGSCWMSYECGWQDSMLKQRARYWNDVSDGSRPRAAACLLFASRNMRKSLKQRTVGQHHRRSSAAQGVFQQQYMCICKRHRRESYAMIAVHVQPDFKARGVTTVRAL
jgi:hypothetical protein